MGGIRTSASSGQVIQSQRHLPKITFAGLEKRGLTVNTEDLQQHRSLYEHNIDGILGTDVFGGQIVVLDLARHRLGIGGISPTPLLELVGQIQGRPIQGLLLLPAALPNGTNSEVVVDTGADSPTDFVFFQDSLQGTSFTVESTSNVTDATGKIERTYNGVIPFVKLGTVVIQPAKITARPAAKENPFGTPHRPGLLACRFFEGFVVEIDFVHTSLRLFRAE